MSIGDVKSETKGSGARYNSGKPAMDLVPLMALEDCAKVFDYGRKKYAEWNWAKGMDWSVPYACMLRHLSAWHQGEDVDPESGLPHLGHAMCNLVMLATYAKTYPEGDNRPTKWFHNALKEISKDAANTKPEARGDSDVTKQWPPGGDYRKDYYDKLRRDRAAFTDSLESGGVPDVQANVQPKNCS